jgi:hypothetical protein
MIFCKIQKLTLFFAALVGVLSVSCSRDSNPRIPIVDQQGDETDSTFVVQTPITLVQAKQSSSGSPASAAAGWTIPTETSFTFRACLQDVAKLEPIISQAFVVHGENGNQRVVSDSAGCINWSETVPFDFAQDETYVESNHWIDGGGGPYRGERHIPVALNPWLETSDAAVDLRQGNSAVPKLLQGDSVSQALSQAQSKTAPAQSQIVLPSATLQSYDIRYSGTAARVALNLILKPTLSRKNLTNQIVQTPIHGGRFQLSMTLVDRIPGVSSDQLIILSEKSLDVSVMNDQILVNASLDLNQKPLDTAIPEIAFSLKPIDAPIALQALEGMLQPGSLQGGSTAAVTPINQGLNSYVAQARANTTTEQNPREQLVTRGATSSCSDGSDQLGYYINTIAVQNLGVTSRTVNENVPNQVLAGFSVCLANTMDRKPITDQPFTTQFGTDSQSLVTDVNGCIRFSETIPFDYFAAEGSKTQNLKISSTTAPFENVSRVFPISIDPWASDDTFFMDCRHGALPVFHTQPARLEMISFSSSFQGQDFAIDPEMNLLLNRRYQVQITPRLARSKGYSGMVGYETIADAKFHMRALLLSPDKDADISAIESATTDDVIANYKYLSSYEADVQARDGQVVEEVTFPQLFQEMPLLGTRNLILVQLSPLDPNSSLVSPPFYAPFSPGLNNGYFGLMPGGSPTAAGPAGEDIRPSSTLDLARLIELGSQSKSAILTRDQSLDQLATQTGLFQVSDAQLQRVGLTQGTLSALFASRVPTLGLLSTEQKFCELLHSVVGAQRLSTDLSKCELNPRASLTFERFKHVDTVNHSVSVVDSDYSTFQVAAMLTVADVASSSSTAQTSHANSSQTSHDQITGATNATNVNVHATADAGLYTKAGVGWTLGVDAESGAEARASAGVGWSKGKTWYTTGQSDSSQVLVDTNATSRETSTGRTNTATGLNSFYKMFGVERMTLAVQGTHRTCLAIRERSTHQVPGILLCESSSSPIQSWTESYYLISEIIGNVANPLRDNQSQTDAPWAKSVRGEVGFKSLQKVLLNRTATLVLTPHNLNVDSLLSLNDRAREFGQTTPSYSDGNLPGVLKEVVEATSSASTRAMRRPTQ